MAQVRKKLAPPLVGSDILLVVRPKQNINQVLDVTYDELISALKTVFPTTSGTGGVSSVNGQTGVVILALDDLSDVNAGSPTSGQVLQWNGTEWVAATVSVTTPSLQQVVDSGNAISNFLPSGNASIQSTNFLSNRTLYLNNDSNPTIKIEDNLNSSHYTIIDIDTINLNGTSYNWSTIVSGTTPDLQQVTNVGATTTNTIVVGNIANINSQILPTNVGTEDATTGTQAFLDYTGFLGLNNGTVQSNLLNTGVTNAGVQLTFPNKPTGTYTIATTADLTTTDIVSPFLLMGG
jgi:hypothetical protein